MNYFSIFALLLFISCDSQTNSKKTKVQFEDIYHHYFNLTAEKYSILDSQEKVDQVYEEIGNHYGGNRRPPIPQVILGEKLVLFKPDLKNANDVEIVSVEIANDILYITAKPFYNPQITEKSRVVPNILIKIYTKQNLKKVIISTPN